MQANDVPSGRVLGLEEIFEDPQIVHNETILEFNHPTAGKYHQAKPAARFHSTSGPAKAHAAAPGRAHRRSVTRDGLQC